jgi:hypothetical protein
VLSNGLAFLLRGIIIDAASKRSEQGRFLNMARQQQRGVRRNDEGASQAPPRFLRGNAGARGIHNIRDPSLI